MTLYVLTSECHDYYRIYAAFETKEDAERALSAGVGEEIGELPYYPAGTIPTKVTMYNFRARLFLGDLINDLEEWSFDTWHFDYRCQSYVSVDPRTRVTHNDSLIIEVRDRDYAVAKEKFEALLRKHGR